MAADVETAPVAPPERTLAQASVVPAVLAGIAEAGLIFLPLQLISRNSSLDPSGGPLAWYPLFLVLFAGGVGVGTRLRDRSRLPAGIAVGCAAVGIVQAVVWNSGGGGGAFVAIMCCLLAGIRVATLSLRDWRDPIEGSFGWGAGILLAEIAFARAVGFSDIVWPIAVLFFLGSLGSRAASVRMVERSVQGAAAGPDSAHRWRIVAMTLAAAAAVLAGIGLVLGTQRGPIDRIAQWLVEGIAAVVYWAAYVVAVVLSWILSVVGVDRNRIQNFIRNLGHRLGRDLHRGSDAAGSVPLWERTVGVAVLFLLIGGLVYLVARQRRKSRTLVDRSLAWVPSQEDEGLFARASEARKRRKLRHEAPEDTVRRLYAEALDELEERGRPRPASVTPGEFLRTLRTDLPDCSAGLGVLTRAYEDVRYGRIDLQTTTIASLEAEWQVLRKMIRAAPLPEPEGDEDHHDALARHLAERAEGAAGAAPSSDETFERR
jgi:hypothetical protein